MFKIVLLVAEHNRFYIAWSTHLISSILSAWKKINNQSICYKIFLLETEKNLEFSQISELINLNMLFIIVQQDEFSQTVSVRTIR